MKHLIIVSLFLISSVLPLKVQAGAAGGGSTEITQLLNMGELIPINISDAITAVSTKGTFVKGYILDPIANALISSALQGASNDILSWVSGGFGGAEPLLITNPEEYLKKQGLKSVKGVLGNIPSDTIFGDSIFNTLLTQYKDKGDLEGTIAELSKSNLPSLIQNNLCKDEKLTSLALGAVQNGDGTYDQQELAEKKTELWNYACAGNADDAVVAARLTDLNEQNPSIGGWDTWLAITSGENEYTRSAKVAKVVQQDLAKKEQIDIKDLFDGLGPISEKECIDPIPAENGEPAGCNEYVTVTPGDQVGGTLTEALTSGMKRLENIMGDGSLTGMLQGFAISAITSGIKKALNSSGGGASYNLPVTLPSSRPVVQDLVNDPLKKTENLKPMNKQLSYYLTSLNNLSALDNKYMSELSAYEAQVTKVKDCAMAGSLYANRMSRITSVKNSITAEQAKIAAAKTLVYETQTKLDASNSSQVQGTIFNEYLSAVEDGGYPSAQAEGIREGEYIRDKFDVEHDTELTNMQSACAQQTTQTQPTETGGCFLAGTMVTMGDGTKKSIENVTFEDKIMTSDGPQQVMKRYVIQYTGLVYAFNGDGNYFVTPTHPFMTTLGWKSLDPEGTRRESPGMQVSKLSIGDVLITANGGRTILTRLDSKFMDTTVFNFGVNGTHDFYADDYLVHNVDTSFIFFQRAYASNHK